MRLFHISDTHGKHRELRNLPIADVFIHSGDFTFGGSDAEAMDFIEWICGLPYAQKIFIAGNHDDCMRNTTPQDLPNNVHYLKDSSTNIAGITFYGAPLLFGMTDGVLGSIEHYSLIPCQTDILISHRPPFGILDGSNHIHLGSHQLLDIVTNFRPFFHLYGHAHDSYGLVKIDGITYSNAAVVDNNYNLQQSGRIIEFSTSRGTQQNRKQDLINNIINL